MFYFLIVEFGVINLFFLLFLPIKILNQPHLELLPPYTSVRWLSEFLTLILSISL